MKKEIISEINRISGEHSPYEVFSDWIRCCSLAVCNSVHLIHNDVWNQRERDYIETLRRYPDGTEYRFAGMFCRLGDLLSEEMTDALGEIYMEAGMGSKTTGQFFTPFHLSELTARSALENVIKNFDGSMITLAEPSTGGGGMIIAAAKVLKEAGINYQKYLDVVAQDLDADAVRHLVPQMAQRLFTDQLRADELLRLVCGHILRVIHRPFRHGLDQGLLQRVDALAGLRADGKEAVIAEGAEALDSL